MIDLKMSSNELEKLYIKLSMISETYENKDACKDNKGSDIYKLFSLSTVSGRHFYESLSNEQLLKKLIQLSEQLGYSPAQKEVFWVWRLYIKKRFQKWTYALEAAGLSKSAGRGGKKIEQFAQEKKDYEELLKKVRYKAKELCRIPHTKDMPELCLDLKKFKHNWSDVIKDAGITQEFLIQNSVHIIEGLEEEYCLYLKELEKQAYKLGRSPLRSEVKAEVKEQLIERCGSWRNVLHQIGLEPVIRMKPFSSTFLDSRQSTKKRRHMDTIHNCYFKILNIDGQTEQDLLYLKNVEVNLERIPGKNDVPADIRKRLQKACGSWTNALYQIKIITAK